MFWLRPKERVGGLGRVLVSAEGGGLGFRTFLVQAEGEGSGFGA